MNRVNYTGLKKRDTYDEIVALVEAVEVLLNILIGSLLKY